MTTGWLAQIRLRKDDLNPLYRDSYAWHQTIWDCFPCVPDKRRDFLTRVEYQRQGCLIHMVCRTEPVRPAWCPDMGWRCKEIPASFFDHTVYLFDTIVNPTRWQCIRDENGLCIDRGKRIGLQDADACRDWLVRQGERHGFVPDVPPDIFNLGMSSFHRQGVRGHHVKMRFKGRLRVTDREAFQNVFYAGIGSAKAFHHGLLMLSPVM